MSSTLIFLLFIVLHPLLILSVPMTIYQNTQFIPMDNYFLLANLSLINSQDTCACQCWTNLLCVTATFNGRNQVCLLYFAQISDGQLQLMTTDMFSTVLSFANKTILVSQEINRPNETVNAIWNTTVGGDSLVAVEGQTVGTYNTGEPPSAVFDDIIATNYNSFGSCSINISALSCGQKTGFYVTLKNGISLLRGFRIRSGHYLAARDPITITLEGSNQNSTLLPFGSSWTFIYNGSTGLDTDPGRNIFGTNQTITTNSMWYSSYRFLVTAKRSSDISVEYSEVQFFGY